MDDFLSRLSATNIHFSPPFIATWAQGRWQFNYNGTEFDIVYTPRSPSFLGYKKTSKSKK